MLISLIFPEILLGALARVLREDGRKSIELSTNIVHIFCCFSVFTQYHQVVAQHKVFNFSF